jgi:hypothetical protein
MRAEGFDPDNALVVAAIDLVRWGSDDDARSRMRLQHRLVGSMCSRSSAVNHLRSNSLSLGDLVCGNLGTDNPGRDDEPRYFPCRSSSIITEFFAGLGTLIGSDEAVIGESAAHVSTAV